MTVASGRSSGVAHLARRFVGSLSTRPPAAADVEWVRSTLGSPDALALWSSMTVQDRRHSIVVARRLVEIVPDAPHEIVVAALLHDVGKMRSGLGTWGRVAATLVGPRGSTFRTYHDHEALGAAMAVEAGCSAATAEAIVGRGPYAADLRRADDV